MFNMNKNAYNDLNRLRCLTKIGIFTSVFLVLELVSKFFVNFTSGYSVNLKIIWYAFVLLSKSIDLTTKFIFAFSSPFIVLIFGFDGINFWQVISEYLVAYWVMFVLVLFQSQSSFLSKHHFLKINWLFVIVTIAFCLNFLVHFFAGIIWWTNYNYFVSAILSFNYIFPSYLISLPLFITAFH